MDDGHAPRVRRARGEAGEDAAVFKRPRRGAAWKRGPPDRKRSDLAPRSRLAPGYTEEQSARRSSEAQRLDQVPNPISSEAIGG